MAWETFNVVVQPIGDGQCQFTRTITNGVLLAGAQFQYSPAVASPPPNPTVTTIFTTMADIPLINGVYTIPDITLPNSFNIPPKSGWGGGNYNSVTGVTYNPTTNTLSGVFGVVALEADEDECSWSAQGGS